MAANAVVRFPAAVMAATNTSSRFLMPTAPSSSRPLTPIKTGCVQTEQSGAPQA